MSDAFDISILDDLRELLTKPRRREPFTVVVPLAVMLSGETIGWDPAQQAMDDPVVYFVDAIWVDCGLGELGFCWWVRDDWGTWSDEDLESL